MKIKRLLKMTAVFSIAALTSVMCIFTIYAQTYNEIGGCLYFEFEDNSYNAKAEIENYYNMTCVSPNWNIYLSEDKKEYALEYENGNYELVKIPDKITGKKKTRYVSAILGSVACQEFDLNPKNKYMSLIDNVVFSKDGKTLMSYAQFNERKTYEIPNGTEIIGEKAFWGCNNIEEISIPDSVKEIQEDAFVFLRLLKKVNISPMVEELNDTFGACTSLKEVYIPENSQLKKISGGAFDNTKISELILPSFEIEIDKEAFIFCKNDLKLKSYVKPNAKFVYSDDVGTYKLSWNEIQNTARYEVYQKIKDGSYKLIKETTGTSIKLNGIKSGKKYVFAVKPIAEITAQGDGGGYRNYDLPEYYTIEGTMSDDVMVVG